MVNCTNSVIFEQLYPDVVEPQRATAGSAGYDVRAYLQGRSIEVLAGSQSRQLFDCKDRLILRPGERAAIPLGFRASLPEGLEAQIRLRSSIAFKKGLVMPNSPATVDSDYPGEWLILVANGINESVAIHHLERIAQIVFTRFETVQWQSGLVIATSNRTGGLGSTGT
jgi:dUTP pyrophosphatase